MACQHVLTNSVTYPVGTRCSRCGKSAESILADVQLQLGDAESKLNEALTRVATLDGENAAAAPLRRMLDSAREELQEHKTRLVELDTQLSQQLSQIESLSKENIRLTNEIRQAVERETALQRKVDEFEKRDRRRPPPPL